MKSRHLLLSVAAVAFAGYLTFDPTVGHAQSKILKAEGGSPGGSTHATTTVFSKYFKAATGYSIQMNDSQTATRSVIKLAKNQIDMMTLPPVIYDFLTKGTRMYKKRAKQSKEWAKEIRSIFGFVANYFHPVTFESSGIKTWRDIKGRRVFTGPPSGAAAVTVENMINIITGYKPGKDYRAVRLNWGSGLQAMMDGQLDVYVRPVPVGAAMIEQLGIKRKFRLLDAGDVTKTEVWKKRYLSASGRVTGVIPAKTYRGQLGGDVVAGGGTMEYVVRRKLPKDLVYKMTKAIWDNIDEIHAATVLLKPINPKTPFVSVNVPLHLGALQYYREKGFKIPSGLVPPEAK